MTPQRCPAQGLWLSRGLEPSLSTGSGPQWPGRAEELESLIPLFHPTQVTPQEMHTREVSWLLFAHEKTQKVNVQVTRAFPCVVQTPALGSVKVSTWPVGYLIQWFCAASRLQVSGDSRALTLNNTALLLQGGKFSVKDRILPMEEFAARCPAWCPVCW